MIGLRILLIAAPLIGILPACTADKEQEIDELFRAYDGAATPGAAVRVIRDGEIVLTRTYGLADLDAGNAVTPATNFRLASLTKQFTATSILMLIEQGRLRLDTVIAQVFPDFPHYGDAISIEYLLQHRSGLPDYEPLVPEDATEQVRDADVLQLMKQQEEGYFEPGSEHRYSNSGYAVLAMMVEETANVSLAEFLEQRIFEPIGMHDTIAFEDGVSSVANRALGYTVIGEEIQLSDQSLYSAVLGDGGVYSSLDDLYLWDQALYEDNLISAASKAKMLTPALENYGFGWRIDTYRGQLRHHHSGSTSGFRNFLQRFPDERLTIIVLTNRAEPDVQPLAERIADLYL